MQVVIMCLAKAGSFGQQFPNSFIDCPKVLYYQIFSIGFMRRMGYYRLIGMV